MANGEQDNGRETLERTLRSVAAGVLKPTGTERMRAALALVELLGEPVPSRVQGILEWEKKSN